MTKRFILFALCFMLLAPRFTAEAQQAGKILRIGYLDSSTASGSAVLVEVFRQEMSKLGWIEGKNITSSTDLRSKSLNGSLSLRRTWFV